MSAAACGVEHDFEPDDRFCCKMTYMRQRGAATVRRPSEVFRRGTIKEQQQEIIRHARSNGYDPQPVGTRWV